ncbi:TetR-like C-terminal domain-containing protein [Streptomyces sp. NPDC006197]|uniref:TetR-like C-terminal domain-containing protein n=1 Tax=Streptomyces sp. NPDC006197 TaxID=3156685 RepID=UPI0033ACA708
MAQRQPRLLPRLGLSSTPSTVAAVVPANRALAAESVQDETFAQQVWDRLIGPRREAVRALLARARERGEVAHPDDDFLIGLVYGPMWYRLLFSRESLDEAYAEQLAATVTAVARTG